MKTIHKKFVIHKKKPIFVCGIDVHKHEMTIALYSANERELEYTKALPFATNPEGLAVFWNYCSKYQPTGFVCEATGVYHHTLVNFLRDQAKHSNWPFEIMIVNPADAAAIPGGAKNDKVDAIRLAKYYWHGLLKHGHHYQKTFDSLKSLFRYADKIERERTKLKNRIKKDLDRNGFRPRGLNLNNDWVIDMLDDFCVFSDTFGKFIEIQSTSANLKGYLKYLTKYKERFEPFYTIKLESTYKILVRQNIFELKLKTARKTLMNIEIEKILQDTVVLRHHAHNLSTIPGISKYNAVWLLVESGNINRFLNARSYLSYAGVAPNIKSSANKVYSAHINRRSNKFMRTMFYNAAVVVTNITKQPSGLKSYADRMKRRKEGRLKVAYCNVAAKIARIAYGILKTNKSK